MLGGALNPKGGHPSRADAHIVHVRAAEASALVHVWHLQPDIILALAAGHNFGACGRTQCWRLRPDTNLALAAGNRFGACNSKQKYDAARETST